jgi:threonylcarbamoyladenosine tRNA methylthiotransferase MtaB
MVKTVAFHNLGCKVNTYEMEKMMKSLKDSGFIIVPFDRSADAYVINTCTVTNIADRKTRQMIHRAKAMNPDAVIVAAGCYVNTHKEDSVKAEGVDICLFNDEKDRIAEKLIAFASERSAADPAEDPTEAVFHTRCFMKVQDGCDAFCSYCIIPYARGRVTSRPVKDVSEETSRRAEQGYREFVLTGIHVSSYGKDRPEDGEGLTELIRGIAQIPGVERIRLSSLEPRIVTEDFVKAISGVPQLCPHFHLSLQSGSDTVLKRMNRHYTAEEYMRGVETLRKYFTDPAITTDIITGFPGETEEEFEETVGFVERVGFYETHIFKYSRRAGTVADRMPGQLSEAVKHERSGILAKLNSRKKKEFEDRHIASGRPAEVLFEDIEVQNGQKMMTGYTKEYIKVYAGADTVWTGQILTGQIRRNNEGIIEFK